MITKKMILDFLNNEAEKPIMDMDLMKHFELMREDAPSLQDFLLELEEEGKVIKTKKGKYAVPIRMNLIFGTLQTTQKGFGFLIPENLDSNDIFIPTAELNGAMNKDKVFVKITSKSGLGKRQEGKVVRIIKRANSTIVGTLEMSDNFGFVIADDKKIGKDIYVSRRDLNGAKAGQKVVVTITQWPEQRRNPEGYISEILGFSSDKGVDILSVIRKYDLPEDFPKKLMREVSDIPVDASEEEIARRLDLRDETIITIDGIDAKDLDDAVNVSRLDNGNYKLGVHIADVTYYVKEGSRIDKEAIKRGTSVYLIDRVIPMLPKELSNGICSLNPRVNRLTMSCIMEIDKNGTVVKHEIKETVIKTVERMTYKDVSDILQNVERDELSKYDYLIDTFKAMEELCLILRAKRDRRGTIDFDFPEPYIVLDETGKPVEIIERERRIANRIIEEFMLVANETVAEHVHWLEYPFVYRIHEEPDMEKIAVFNKFLHNFGYVIKGANEEVHPKEIQKLLREVTGKKEERVINKLMLRSLKQAKYSPHNEGHFGLAAKFYSHFTSPIRRYPDLQIHRILKELINNQLSPSRVKELGGIVEYISKQASDRERVAEQAERETDDLKKAEYMSQFIGDEFEGFVSSVTSFGIFTELDNTCEGLTKVSMLDDDYYIYNEEKLMFIGERTKKTYTIGDRVIIRVESVNITNKEVDFKVLYKIEED
jgi:ribonuclease R